MYLLLKLVRENPFMRAVVAREVQQLLVIKKDNSRELFDAQKVRSGVIAACHKRPVSPQQISRMIDEIE